MSILLALIATLLIVIVLFDLYQTVILPRRGGRRLRLTKIIYILTWTPVSRFVIHIKDSEKKENILGMYGPLTLVLLLVSWGFFLILGFALLQFAIGAHLQTPTGHVGFGTTFYMSGTTLFTLGLGDVFPTSPLARIFTVVEAGVGFSILAIVIGYFPVLYQAFSRREARISLLDARAGSPPSALGFLKRHIHNKEDITRFLQDWEYWSAELMESHISYPELAFFRSQHEKQSWLSALTVILDVCCLILSGITEIPDKNAQETFAIARHASVDLSQVFGARPISNSNRFVDVQRIKIVVQELGVQVLNDEAAEQKFTELRALYEPYVIALSGFLLFPLPSWFPDEVAPDDWETTSWKHEKT